MSWRVYILECADGTLYTGITNDLDARLAVHNAGKGARYTRSRLPVRVVYSEPAPDRSSASAREAGLKALSRAEKLTLIHSDIGQPQDGDHCQSDTVPSTKNLR